MVRLDFIVDENYLVAHTLSNASRKRFSSKAHEAEIRAFQKQAWKTSKTCHDLLIGQPSPRVLTDVGIAEMARKMPEFLFTVKRGRYFKQILGQTRAYSEECRRQWEANYSTTNRIITRLTGFTMRKTFTVYITHPDLKNGIYLGENRIAWGHSEDWPNYTTVYLWHEILHSYFDTKQLDHVVISFMTDEELRVCLNGGTYPPFMTHDYLHEAMGRALPLWKKYLACGAGDIMAFRERLAEDI